MKTVQLAIHDSEYAQSLRNLLLRDGTHRVYLVDHPDLRLDGVVVVDQNNFESLSAVHPEPDRFVVITPRGSDHLSRVWDAGVRHVVFQEDSPNTAQLAVIAAELRLPRLGARSSRAPALQEEKHVTRSCAGCEPLDSLVRCSSCYSQHPETSLI